MKLPRRISRKSGRDGRLRSPGHLKWIRGFECSCTAAVLHTRKVEAAHVRTGTDGAMGMKPSDNWTIPLCDMHHKIQHDMGETAFEQTYGVDMKAIAQALWQRSPHRRKVA